MANKNSKRHKFPHAWICNQTGYSTKIQQTHQINRLNFKLPNFHGKLAMNMPLLDISTPQKTALNDGLSTPSYPPSADARLLRDLKEQVTVLQKDMSQQAQRGSGRGMVIKNTWKNVGLSFFFLMFLFHSFNLQWFRKRRECVRVCVCVCARKTNHWKNMFFSQHT